MASADPRDPQYGAAYVGNADVQRATITGTPTGGTFTLTFAGSTTAGIAYNAAASVVQTAFTGLASVGSSNATVSGSAGGPYTITFAGSKAPGYQVLITASGAGLTGGTSPAVAVTKVTNGSPMRQLPRGSATQSVLDMYSMTSRLVATTANDNHYTPNGDLYHE